MLSSNLWPEKETKIWKRLFRLTLQTAKSKDSSKKNLLQQRRKEDQERQELTTLVKNQRWRRKKLQSRL
jgi:hypothetical protein